MSFDYSHYFERAVQAIQQLTGSLEEEFHGAMFDVRAAMDTVQKTVIKAHAAGPHFVQVSVAEHSSDGFKGGCVVALDNKGRVWAKRLDEVKWQKLPDHPELF